jgi:hypothetical protein
LSSSAAIFASCCIRAIPLARNHRLPAVPKLLAQSSKPDATRSPTFSLIRWMAGGLPPSWCLSCEGGRRLRYLRPRCHRSGCPGFSGRRA